jgi:phosphoenolpyruvate synthase/pyruvate phosphate dikinase
MKKWRIINKQNNANLYPYAIHILSMGKGFRETFGQAYSNLVELKNDGYLTQAVIWRQYHALGKKIMNRLLEDKTYAKKALTKSYQLMAKWFDFSKQIIKDDLTKDTNAELARRVDKFRNLFYQTSNWGVLISIVEYEHELLTNKVKEFLKKKIKTEKLDINIEDLFQLVTTKFAVSYVVKERNDLLNLALRVYQNKKWNIFISKNFSQVMTDLSKYQKLDSLVDKHLRRYVWLSFAFEGPALTKGDVVKSLQEHLKKNPVKVKKDISQNQAELKARQKKYLRLLKLDESGKNLINVAKDFGFSKSYRKDIEYHCNYAYHKLLAEIGRRFYFTPHQGHYLTPDELIDVLKRKRQVDINEINQRIKHCIYLVENGREKLLSGQMAKALRREFFEQEHKIADDLRGQCAMSGYARGRAKIIMGQEDFHKFAAHNILVSYATNPSFVPLMKIARAIITDQGGITCHAAIVSRELGVPCVIGTKAATKVLKDGDELEVDATNGIIKKI